MDYETFFNLRERPFKNTSNKRYFYPGEVFYKITATLTQEKIPRRLLLTGAKSTGKTTTLLFLGSLLTREGTVVALVKRANQNITGILTEALASLGLNQPTGTPEETLLGIFHNAATEILDSRLKLVLAIDDAQNLQPGVISDLEALTNLDPSWAGHTSLLLAGRLEECFALDNLSQDTQIFHQTPLNPSQTADYVKFRLKNAGARRALFSPDALAGLYSYSHGIIPLINSLADRALLTAWSLGKKEITLNHLAQAKITLENPLSINPNLAQSAKGKIQRPKDNFKTRRPMIVLGLMILAGFLGIFLFLSPKRPILDLEGGGLASANSVDLEFAENQASPEENPATTPTLTPAATPTTREETPNLGLPTPPPTLLSLPRNSLALITDRSVNMARLWQGSIKGPGLKAEIAPPDIQESGLYLVGRPQSRTPLIFQFPPALSIPKNVPATLWKQVEAFLPLDILPLMVGNGQDLNLPVPPELGNVIRDKIKAWTQNQEFKLAENVALLYADKFRFYEPRHADRLISREDFRKALNSELKASGDVRLTVSEPLIMLDPKNRSRVWAIFNLKYDSRLRHDLGLRTLIFERNRLATDWRIVAELWIKEIIPKNS
ncbi:MAG: AAA family ATPase [Deltaproteobacteria bacterium]|jgi:type II secretory pathway predicted ATPase ExeA|nr:AAA family ATPase [Deltaproteobacteria bacterium]